MTTMNDSDAYKSLIPPTLELVSVWDYYSSKDHDNEDTVSTKRTVSLLRVAKKASTNSNNDNENETPTAQDEEASIPLLFSTTRLLERFQIPLHVSSTPGNNDNEDDSPKIHPLWISEETPATESPDAELHTQLQTQLTIKDDNKEGEENTVDDFDSQMIPDARSFDEPAPKESPPQKKTPSSSPKTAKVSSSFQSLPRVDNAAEMMRTALTDIYLFQHRIRSKQQTKQKQQSTPNQRKENRRLHALTTARDRLQQQLQTKEEQASSNETPDDDEEEENPHDSDASDQEKEQDEDDDDPDESNSNDDTRDPWMRLIRTVNSLAVLTPIVLHMLFHPQRNNRDLRIGKVSIVANHKQNNKHNSKRRGGGGGGVDKCWLILEGRGFDVCSQKSAKGCYGLLRDIYAAMGSFVRPPMSMTKQQQYYPSSSFHPERDEAVFRQHWPTAVEELLQNLLQVADNQGFCTKSTPQHPLSSICQTNEGLTLEQAESIAQKLDETWGLREETLSPAEVKRQADYEKAISNLQKRVFGLLRGRFRRKNDDDDIRLSVYGSCLSNLSLGRNSDVDLSLYLRSASQNLQAFESGEMGANRYDKDRKNTVYKICRALEQGSGRNEFTDMQPIAHARVPVVRGCYKAANNPFHAQGHMAFDICLLNDIAVVNSSLIREYCLVDPRVKMLCKAVKQWAKAQKISSAADSTLSSYAWTNMVLVYLQQHELIPNLQSRELAKEAGVKLQDDDPWHSIKNLDTFYLKWDQVKHVWRPPANLKNVSISALLFGFFEFYGSSRIQSSLFVLGLNTNDAQSLSEDAEQPMPRLIPRTVFRRCSWFWTVQDPFETFDSHCPHDLASHAEKDNAILVIRWYLHEAHQILLDAIRNSGGQGQAFEQWPSVVCDSETGANEGNNTKRGQGTKNASTPKKMQPTQSGNVNNGAGERNSRNRRRNNNSAKKQATPQKGQNDSNKMQIKPTPNKQPNATPNKNEPNASNNDKDASKDQSNSSNKAPTPKKKQFHKPRNNKATPQKQPNAKNEASPAKANVQSSGASPNGNDSKSPPKRNNRNQRRFANKTRGNKGEDSENRPKDSPSPKGNSPKKAQPQNDTKGPTPKVVSDPKS